MMEILFRARTFPRLCVGLICICVLPTVPRSETSFRLAAGINQPILEYQDNTGTVVSNNIYIRPEVYGAMQRRLAGPLYGELGVGFRNLGGKIDFVNSYRQDWREYYQYRYLYFSADMSLSNFKFGFGEGVFVGYEFSYLADAYRRGRCSGCFGEIPVESIYDRVPEYNNGVDFGVDYPIYHKLILKLKYAYEFNNVTELKGSGFTSKSNLSCFSALISVPIRFYFW